MSTERIRRFRLMLGKKADEPLRALGPAGLQPADVEIDEALGAVYDPPEEDEDGERERRGGLGASAPRLAKWLGDIRGYFPTDVVSVIQSDAIERRGLKQLLFEPELLSQVTPSIELVGTLMSLSGMIPERTKETARVVVRAVVDELVRKLEADVVAAVRGALDRSRHSPIPSLPNLDWRRTVRENLRNVQKDGLMIPDRFYFYSRQVKRKDWTVIVCMDQSGSMADSVVYGAVTGSILASMPALETHVVVFDTEVVDLTERCTDPVDLLFGVQLGGGTDIHRAVTYCSGLVTRPERTLLILITDLFEGGNQAELLRRLEDLVDTGVRVVTLLALSDKGVPSYDEHLAKRVRELGVPCFACTPTLLPELLSGALRGVDLEALARRLVPE